MEQKSKTNPAKRIGALVGGGLLLVIGIVLLVLPGPGLLLVLAGLVVLSKQFPAVEKYVHPVQDRAMKAAEQSVSSPLRIAGSVLAGLVLIGGGVAWGLLGKRVWLGGWATGSSLILSGLVLLALLVYSYRRVQAKRREQPAAHDASR
jgi:Putative transmembrane protein (PGPGW)